MSMEARVMLVVALVAALGGLVVSFLQSWRGKAVRGTLHVPQGKTRINVEVTDDKPLRPYKYGQVFEAQYCVQDDTASGGKTNAVRYKRATIGHADPQSNYTRALARLAAQNNKVLVRTVVMGLNEHNRPIVQLVLPESQWFVRALGTSKQNA